MTHECQYRQRLQWGAWTLEGQIRRREGRRVPRCVECGSERPARRRRRVERYEIEAAGSNPAPLPDRAARRLADCLLRKASGMTEARRPVSLKGVAASTKLPASQIEEWMEAFLHAGWVGLQYSVRGTQHKLASVNVLDAEALAELAHPGLRGALQAAISDAHKRLQAIEHPVAEQVVELISNQDSARLDPPLVRALTALAVFAASGEVCAERVFSSQHLDDSKALGRLRVRLERLVGPLESLGIRQGAATTLVGGEGKLVVDRHTLDLAVLRPFLGLSRDTIELLSDVTFPGNGLLVVENLTAFEACCRGEVPGASHSLVVWSAGYPGRAVRALVEAAKARSKEIRVWADIDLDGVRIARLICRWAEGEARPWRMSVSDLHAATNKRPLSERAARAIASDLRSHPGALLTGTLEAIVEQGCWAEQEALLVE